MGWAIDAAKRDPVGARIALLHYGMERDWPACQLGPIKLEEGKQEWAVSLLNAVPLYLGLAWEASGEPAVIRPTTNVVSSMTSGKQGLDTPNKEKPVPVIEWKDAVGVEPGIYPAVVREIVEEEGKFGPQLRLQFIILDDKGNDTVGQIRGWTSAKWGEKTKLLSWAKILLRGRCPKESEPIDTDDLLNRKCDLEVVEVQTANGPRGKIAQLYAYRSMSVKEEEEEV